MASTSLSSPAAYVRLQDNLKLGLTCVKDLWQHEVKDWITSIHAADIDQDGDVEILAGSHSGRVYALSKDGIVKWERIVGNKEWITAIVAFPPVSEQRDACAVISTRGGKIYVLDQQGREIAPPDSGASTDTYWYNVGQPVTQMWLDTSQPLTVIFSSDDFRVYSFDIVRNRLRWQFQIDDPIRAIFSCDVDGDGLAETLIGSENQMLYLLSSTGKLIATRLMEQAIYTLFAADIDRDKKIEILVGTRTKKLFALTPELDEKWSQALSSRPLAISVVDVNSDSQPEIVVTCDDQSLSILNNMGKPIWRHNLNKRYQCLNTSDIDRDGHIEILAGTDDSRVLALRIQLSKDLDKKIRRDYTAIGKPEITTLTDLTNEQLNLLLALLGTAYGTIDKNLSLATAKTLLEAGDFTQTLLLLLKLDRQHFQLQWEKSKMGFRRALCLVGLAGNKGHEIVVGSREGGLSIFSANGRLLGSEKSPDGDLVFDAQSGYLSKGLGEDLAFASASGNLSIMHAEKTRPITTLQFSEKVACFYMLAPDNQSAVDILIGTQGGKAHLYTNNFEQPARIFDMPAKVQRVYASEPDESGKYRNPELLISTSENVLFAYTRGGNQLWKYQTPSRILALCAKDLDGDGRLEVLIGSEDRNIYVLDDNGNLRWRYVLYNTVLALETADIDNDGQQEILAGCGDGVLYVFTSKGDLIWRYISRDPIQALRAADIDQDGNFEIAMVEESHLEVLQIIKQQELDELMAICWEHLLADRNPLDTLLPLIKGNNPDLRAAALTQMATLTPLPSEAFDLFSDAVNDTFTNVRKILPEAIMRVYPANPLRARELLNNLFTNQPRDVRIEVVEHLELLAKHDWNEVLYYLGRALRSAERNTRRAVLRKISLLLRQYADEIKSSQQILGEALFTLLLNAAQDTVSIWIKQEAGRVLADFLNLFEEDFLLYLHRMFDSRLEYEALQHTAYNLSSPMIQRTVVSLLTLKFDLDKTDAEAALANAARTLEIVKKNHYSYSTDLWLIFHELRDIFSLSSIEKLSNYDFHLKSEHFQTTDSPYPHSQAFLHIGEHLNFITRPLKIYLRRTDPSDRLSSLLDSIAALDNLQRLVDKEYGVSPLPDAPRPLLPEFIVLKSLMTRWQEMFSTQRNELRGHAELICDLQSRVALREDTVGIWLQIANHGRAPARGVQVTLLADESFTIPRPSSLIQASLTFATDVIQVGQEIVAEFLIKPLNNFATLAFEVIYDDSENDARKTYQERLDFIEWHQPFTLIQNPYTTGTPIHDSNMFYGREADLAYLLDNLTHTTAQTVLVLYGQRRSGKTTLLNQLAATDLLAQHVPVMIDMQGWSYKLTLNKLLFNISHAIYKAMVSRNLAATEPQRRDFFDEQGYKPDPIFSFEEFLDSVRFSLQERKLILLLDEFEILENQVKKGNLEPEIFEYLRSLMQKRHYIHFLLSGTHQIHELTRRYWSVFFNIALHYRLPGKISAKGAEALITKPVVNLEYEPLAVKKIRLLTADQPYLIHLVCRELVSLCNKKLKNYVTINDVNLVLKSVLETGTIHFNWLWNDKLMKRTQQALLLIIAEGSRDDGRQLDLDDIIAIYDQHHIAHHPDEIIHALNALLAEDVIETNGGEQHESIAENARYSIPVGLLRQWLRQAKSLNAFLHQPEQSTLDEYEEEQFAQLAGDENNGKSDKPQVPLPFYSPDV